MDVGKTTQETGVEVLVQVSIWGASIDLCVYKLDWIDQTDRLEQARRVQTGHQNQRAQDWISTVSACVRLRLFLLLARAFVSTRGTEGMDSFGGVRPSTAAVTGLPPT